MEKLSLFFPLEINIYFKLIKVLSIFLDYFNHFLTSSHASAFDSHSLFLKRTGMILSTREFIYIYIFLVYACLQSLHYLLPLSEMILPHMTTSLTSSLS